MCSGRRQLHEVPEEGVARGFLRWMELFSSGSYARGVRYVIESARRIETTTYDDNTLVSPTLSNSAFVNGSIISFLFAFLRKLPMSESGSIFIVLFLDETMTQEESAMCEMSGDGC